jgi:hypothetical protein
VVEGWSNAASDGVQADLTPLREGLTEYEATGAAQMRSYGLCLLADALARAERWPEALETANAALLEIRRSGIVFYAPEAHRLRGEALCHASQTRSGLASLLQGLRLADQHGSRPLFVKSSTLCLKWLDAGPLRALVKKRSADASARMAAPGSPS